LVTSDYCYSTAATVLVVKFGVRSSLGLAAFSVTLMLHTPHSSSTTPMPREKQICDR
jgi:hypothetical protein